MEICNSYYLIPNDKNQINCSKWLKNFFTPEIVLKEEKAKEEGDVVVDIPTTANWVEFQKEYKDKTYKAFYKTYYGNAKNRKDAGFYLDIKIDYQNNKRKYADILSTIIQDLKIAKRTDFYLVVLNDELSRYFAEISYRSLSIYERKLRKLLLVITAPAGGENWSNNLGESNTVVNSTGKSSIEQGLEELDLSEYESLFFDIVVNFNEDNYDRKFKLENLNQLSKSDIIQIIRTNKPESFWNKYIQKYIQIDNIAVRMKNIRKQRNKIAHNKYFSSEDQKRFSKDVNYITRKIDEAIEEIINNSDKFDTNDMTRSLNALKKAVNIAIASLGSYGEVLKSFIELGVDEKIAERYSKELRHLFEKKLT